MDWFQIEAMRVAHEKELTRIRAEQAVYNSTSKLASLQSRCDSQEVGFLFCYFLFLLFSSAVGGG